MKHCKKCKTDKPLTEFHKDRCQPDGLKYSCKPCCIAASKRSQALKPEYYRQQRADWKQTPKGQAKQARDATRRRLRAYGLTLEQYEFLREQQEGKCAICARVPEAGKGAGHSFDGFYIDHDHVNGRVRGLLCNKCNPALGYLKDDPEVARRIITYLEYHNAFRSNTTAPVSGQKTDTSDSSTEGNQLPVKGYQTSTIH